jgi:hypothetical protein
VKINTKIKILQFSTIFFVGLLLFILNNTYQRASEFKELQLQFSNMLDLEATLEIQLREILYTEDHIIESGQRVIDSYNELRRFLDSFKMQITDQKRAFLGEYNKFYFRWYEINDIYYLPIIKYLNEMILPTNGFDVIVANRGIVKARDLAIEANKKGELNDQKTLVLVEAARLIIAQKASNEILKEMLNNNIQNQINKEMVYNSALNFTAVIFIILTIICISMIISTKISNNLIRKIKNMEASFYKISQGRS